MQVESLQKFCLSLPAVTEDINWSDNLCFSIGSKMFCIVNLNEPFKCSFKVPDEDFDELSNKEGFMPAPYMARAKWILVTKPSALSKKDWENYLTKSYELIKAKLTKKVKKEFGID